MNPPIPLPPPLPLALMPAPANENNDENGHRYVGLVNQAMTCYLNSLIQSLYMTPEFRNAIYDWKLSSSNVQNEATNIPYQLQKLFLLLQTSDKSSLETKDLTASFGWNSNEAYDQHDVQELCRIMFDALEHKWRNTKNSTVIQDLYKGTMEDYVKCLGCHQESKKEDAFLDLPLSIKPFGSSQSYRSVEEALKAFIKPEVLTGNNQYECGKCASKQDAEKGLRITGFPRLLTIQLKRFDFDYQTLHRMKLNNRVTFPDYLDLNDYIYISPPSPPPEPPKMSYAAAAKKPKSEPSCSKEPDDSPPEDPFMPPSTSNAEAGASNANEEEEGKREWLDVPATDEKVQLMLKRGPYVYELFSIMVHQGSASAGHYFAYIKNMDQNLWFCFNDSSVQSATFREIVRTFGGFSYGYMSNMNAYMLMYRKVDPDKNMHFVRTLELPQHLKELQQKLKIEEEERERRLRHEQELIKIHFICNDPLYLASDPEFRNPHVLLLHKDVSLDTVFSELVNKLEERNPALMDRLRFSRLLVCDSTWAIQSLAVQYTEQSEEGRVIIDEIAEEEDVAATTAKEEKGGDDEDNKAGGNDENEENKDDVATTAKEKSGEDEICYAVGSDEDYKRPLETLLPTPIFSSAFYRQELHLMVDTQPNEDIECKKFAMYLRVIVPSHSQITLARRWQSQMTEAQQQHQQEQSSFLPPNDQQEGEPMDDQACPAAASPNLLVYESISKVIGPARNPSATLKNLLREAALKKQTQGREELLEHEGDEEDDDQLGGKWEENASISSCPSTPKISPVVSEASGDEMGYTGRRVREEHDDESNPQHHRAHQKIAPEQYFAAEKMLESGDNVLYYGTPNDNYERYEKMMLFSRDTIPDTTSMAVATVGTLTTTEMATTTTEMDDSRCGDEETIDMLIGGGAGGGGSSDIGCGGGGLSSNGEEENVAAASDTLVGGTESNNNSDTTTAASSIGEPVGGDGGGPSCDAHTTDAAEFFAETSEESQTEREQKFVLECARTGAAKLLLASAENDLTKPYLLLQIDRRAKAKLLKLWLADYFNLDEAKFTLRKHYLSDPDGYVFSPTSLQTFGDAFYTISDRISMVLNPDALPPIQMDQNAAGGNQSQQQQQQEGNAGAGETSNSGGGGFNTNVAGPSGTGNGDDADTHPGWKRRSERPLRIKIMSESDPQS